MAKQCDECGQPAKWVRATQFSGNHYFCEEHAHQEKNFGAEDPSYFVWRRANMKVIGRDNYDRDTVDDILVAEGLNEGPACRLAEEKNAEGGERAPYFYVVVADDYVLKHWEP